MFHYILSNKRNYNFLILNTFFTLDLYSNLFLNLNIIFVLKVVFYMYIIYGYTPYDNIIRSSL